MIYEAPMIAIDPILGEVIESSGGPTYLPDDNFPE